MAGWLGKRTQPQPAQHLCACGTRLLRLAAAWTGAKCQIRMRARGWTNQGRVSRCLLRMPRYHACSCNRPFAFPSLAPRTPANSHRPVNFQAHEPRTPSRLVLFLPTPSPTPLCATIVPLHDQIFAHALTLSYRYIYMVLLLYLQ